MARLFDENKIVTPTLLRRFELEAEGEGGDRRYYGCILLPDGNLIVHHPGSPALAPEQLMWAQDVLRFLNRELHHDGAWVVVFTHPKPASVENPLLAVNLHAEYARYVLLWLDQDGDVQIPIEWMEGDGEAGLRDWTDVLLAGMDAVGMAATYAWDAWHRLMVQVIDRKEGRDTFKRAQGEAPKSTGIS
jgi:hypothetical protein